MDDLITEIKGAGFQCNCCGSCCSREVNRHVFLLDNDVAAIRSFDPGALEPAPDPEFCDQHGTLYVSGYALRTKDDTSGACRFLSANRCLIYDTRPLICRIYPFMLRRNTGTVDTMSWRFLSQQRDHGDVRADIPDHELHTLAREVREYENGFLTQQIAFLECIGEHFAENGLWHSHEMYNDQMRAFYCKKPITVMAYHAGQLEEHRLIKTATSV